MRITLNLLPEKRKKKIRKAKMLRFVVWQEVLIIFTVVIFLLMLVSINFILTSNLNEIQKEGEKYAGKIEFQEISKYELNFGEINKGVDLVSSIQKNNYYWTNFFYELSSLAPPEVKLNSLVTEEVNISLIGRSETRDDLIVFKERLEKSECFHSVDVPLSNIVKKENIDFRIDLKINKDCLKIKR